MGQVGVRAIEKLGRDAMGNVLTADSVAREGYFGDGEETRTDLGVRIWQKLGGLWKLMEEGFFLNHGPRRE